MFPDIFSSFFSSYILLSMTTLIVLLGAIYLYVNHRMSEQEHKIASVVEVVRRIIADTQVIKSQLFGGLVPDQNNEVNDFMQDGGTVGNTCSGR